MGADVRLPAMRGGILPGLLALAAAGAAMAARAWILLLAVVVTAHWRQRTGFDPAVRSQMSNPFTGRWWRAVSCWAICCRRTSPGQLTGRSGQART